MASARRAHAVGTLLVVLVVLVAFVAADSFVLDAPMASGNDPGSAPWRLVGLGDSVAAGANCPACATFLDVYADDIAEDTGHPMTVVNFGAGGWTTRDVLASLADGATAAQVGAADFITVTVGANDLAPLHDVAARGDCGGQDDLGCFESRLEDMQTTLGLILQRIAQLRRTRPTAVLVTGYWNVFLDGAVGREVDGAEFERTSATLTRRANDLIRQVALEHDDTYVDLYRPFRGPSGEDDDTGLLAGDGDHPNQAGHRVIAEALRAAGYLPVVRPRQPPPTSAPLGTPAPLAATTTGRLDRLANRVGSR